MVWQVFGALKLQSIAELDEDGEPVAYHADYADYIVSVGLTDNHVREYLERTLWGMQQQLSNYQLDRYEALDDFF